MFLKAIEITCQYVAFILKEVLIQPLIILLKFVETCLHFLNMLLEFFEKGEVIAALQAKLIDFHVQS